MYRFFKHKDQWRYIEKTWNNSKPIDTFALENILGVMGGPEVIVVRQQPGSGDTYHITVKNGFIIKAESIYERVECVNDDGCQQCFNVIDRDEVLEFLATEITL